MDNYLNTLIETYRSNTNKEVAKAQKQYMRNKFEFLGIKTPLRNEILKKHYKTFGKLDIDKSRNYVKYLWELPEREFQYVAINIAEKLSKSFVPQDIDFLEYLIENKSWWDSVDGVVRLNKVYFQKHPELIKEHTNRWINSENFWFQRSALLFQLNNREKMDKELMFEYINKVSHSNEFFVQKAIGWILRQYSKYYPEIVEDFVANNKLAPLSKREALKVIKKNAISS